MTLNNSDGDIRAQCVKLYDEELETLCEKLNPAYTSYTDCKERYAGIMDYFRVQLHRGYITKEQYLERARMFVGYNEKQKKRD